MKGSRVDSTAARAVRFDDLAVLPLLFGPRDEHLRLIEKTLGVRLFPKGHDVRVDGSDDSAREVAASVLVGLYKALRKGIPVAVNDVAAAIRMVANDRNADVLAVFQDVVFKTSRNWIVTPKSVAQKQYLDAIREKDVVFGIGPAGTGKTFLAMAMAVGALVRKDVRRIILARPAVEAGEKLGFLPGDMAEKVNPYLRPLYDSLYALLDFEQGSAMLERGAIEVAPLAFMRGRTLNDAFVILDEAQNTTSEQMKMFLTRIGFGTKAVVTGDITQTDLPSGRISGLTEAIRVLEGVDGVSFCWFTDVDVVRHPIVQEIVRAYERFEKK